MCCVFVLQLHKLQAVVCEKDVRFQEQIQKHEEELMKVTTQSQNDGELQQVQRYSLICSQCIFTYFNIGKKLLTLTVYALYSATQINLHSQSHKYDPEGFM